MPYETIWEKKGAFTKWWGHSTSSELIQFLQRGQATPNFDSARYSIHDFSACESYSYNEKEVDYVAALDSAGAATNFVIKIAVVAQLSEVINMVNTYKTTMLSPYPVQLFSTLDEARKWVDSD